MNRRKSEKSFHGSKGNRTSGFLRKFVTLWVLASFILSSTPADASRLDRPDMTRAERHEARQAERLARIVPTVSTNTVVSQPQLAPIFQTPVRHQHVNALQQPRIARTELTTSTRGSRNTVQSLDSGRMRNVNGRLNLDLSSTQDNIVLGGKLFENSPGSVTLTVGGAEKTFTAGSKVTAAEYASILQALNGGQSLVLDDKGKASGGSLNFESLTANGDNLRLSSLVIPENVNAIGNFSRNSDVRLNGDLVNNGSIYALSNRDGGTKATIATNNLTNASGGLISSVPNASLGSNLAPSVDLKLRADDTLTNSGRIESSGDLTLSAGSQIINGDVKGNHVNASSAAVVAQNNLYLEAPSITNAGTMSATTGNVNINSIAGATDGSININNTNGTIQALNGNINVRDANSLAKPDTTITGGDLLSKQLNINGSDGAVEVHVDNIKGTINATAGTAHVSAAQSSLLLGDITTSGDPTFTSTTDIFITGANNFTGNAVTYIAQGNIILDVGATVNTSGATTGGNILMVAGANFQDATTPAHIGQDWILGGTTAGGFITDSGTATITSNGGTGAAGSIQLIAFESNTGTTGDVFLPNTTITAQGGTGAANGAITAIGRSVSVFSVNARGAGTTAGTGSISLNSFDPVITGGTEVRINDATGAIVSGGFGVGGTPIVAGNITAGDLQAGGSVAVRSSSNVFMDDIVLANSTSITSLGGQFYSNDWSITSPLGITMVAGGGIVTNTPANTNYTISVDATNAGNITIVAGAAFTETSAQVTVTGASTTGGFIDFFGNPLTNLSATSTGGGTGGNITIADFAGGSFNGDIFISTINPISTSGAGANSNGNLSVVGSSINLGDLVTSGGTVGTGDITVATTVPSTGAGVTINKTTGAASVNFTGGSTIGTASVTINSMDAGDDITITAGSFASLPTAFGTTQTSMLVTAGGQVDLGQIDVGLNLSVATNDDIQILSDITAPAGISLVAGLSIFTGADFTNISTSSSTANGGDIVMVAGAAFNQTGSTITVTGGSVAGGAIDFDFFQLSTLNTSSSLTNGSGGDITLATFFGTANSGFIFTDANTQITTGGLGTGSNGNFTAIAGRPTGNGMGILGPLNTSGALTNPSGNIVLASATPNVTPNVIIQRSDATLTNSFIGGAVQSGSIFTGSISATRGSAVITTGGTIDLSGNVSTRNGILLVAGHDIFASTNGLTISTQGTGGTGNIAMIAGATFTQSAANVTVTGGSTTGGQIDFDANNLATITTNNTAGGGAAGAVTLVAFTGTDNSGRVLMDLATGTITTGSNGAGNNGNVIVVAGNTNNFGIQLHDINTTGGALNTGDISLATSTPDAAPAVVFLTSNASTAGDLRGGTVNTSSITANVLTVNNGADITTQGGATSVQNLTGGANSVLTMTTNAGTDINVGGTISTGTANITAGRDAILGIVNQGAAGSLTVVSGAAGSVLVNQITTGTVRITAGSNGVEFLSTVSANNILTTSTGTILIDNDITAPGGIALISGRDIFANAFNIIDLSSASASTNAGDITLIAGAAFTQNATQVNITGASTTGGAIDFDFNNVHNINARSTAANGSGGDVTMAAFTGTDGTGFIYTEPTTSNITTGGTGTGTNGTFTAIAQCAGGDGIGIRGTLNTTGGDATTGDVYIATATPVTAPNVVISKSTVSISSGNFQGGALANSNVFVDNVTVGNGADITIRSGLDINTVALSGGANSVLTMTANRDISSTGTITLGTANITAGRDVFLSVINQGATGSLNVASGAAAGVTIDTITSGAVRVTAGATGLEFLSTVNANSVVATSRDVILLDNAITAPGGIALVAGTDIFANVANVVTLSTASATTNAGDITLVAGAAFTENATQVTITGASTTGGAIDFDFNNAGAINARSTAANGSGGDVTMVAFAGTNPLSGFVFTEPTTSVITTGGTGSGTSGTFTAIGQAQGGDGIGIRGSLNTTGGNPTTGDVYIATATPVTTTNVVVSKASVSITAGDFRGGAVAPSNVFVDNITVGNGADITIRSGADVTTLALTGGVNSVLTITSTGTTNLGSTNLGTATITAGVDVFAGNILQGTGGGTSLVITAGNELQVAQITSGSINLRAGANLFLGGPITSNTFFSGVAGTFIDLDNDITAPSGILLVAGRDIQDNTGGVVDLSTASATGNAGDITIIAGAAFSQTATDVTITGASPTGGFIDFDFLALNSIDSRSTGGGGSGGDVTMVAFTGSANTGFIFTDPAGTIRTGGNGAGTNGTFTAVAGATTGFGLGIRGTLTTTGGNPTTGDVFLATALPDTTPNVVVSKTSASISTGDFKTSGVPAASDIFVDVVNVGNGADITVNSGANVSADTFNAGANSVVTITSAASTQINASNAGTVTITAGTFVSAGNFIQGANGSLTITAGTNLSVNQVNTGNVRLTSGGFLDTNDTITVTGSIAATSVNTINIHNDLTAPGGILLVSGHDIFSASNVVDLSTASTTGDAGDMSLIAGATFTQNATTVTITGGSGTGGGIDLDTNGVLTVTTRSTSANGSGGDLTMVAFKGSDAGSGIVFTEPNGNITTGGNGVGLNGNIIAVAGQTTGTALGIRGLSIDTTGGSGGSGNVLLTAAAPKTTPINPILSKVTGGVTTGSFLGNNVNNANAVIDTITVGSGATVDISAGGFVSLASINGLLGSSTIRVAAGSSLDTFGALTGGSVTLTSGTFTQLRGNITAPQGILIVAGGDIFPATGGLSFSANSTTGNAGNISMIAGATFTQDANTVTVTGASATGGRIDLDFNNVAQLTANSTFAGGSGGDITLVAYTGSGGTGDIFTDAATIINAGGNGAGGNGDITFVASKNDGNNSIFINGVINLIGGAQGTGSISLNATNFNGAVTLLKANAGVSTGSFTGGTLRNGNINSGNLTVRGGAITAVTGANLGLAALNVSGNGNGSGGSITLTSGSANVLTLGAAVGNSVTSLNAAGGVTSGDGGSITATSTGTGGIAINGALPVTATEGDGGQITLNATNGPITFNVPATLAANAGTASATAHDGGSITLNSTSVVATSNVNLQANGVSGGNGGVILVTSNGSDITLGTGNGQFTATANGANGNISFIASGAGADIIDSATGNISAAVVNLTSNAGVLTINGSITGTTGVNLTVNGANNISGTGSVNGGLLSIVAGTGSTTLNTAVSTLGVSTNGNVTITETDDITINAGSTGAGLLSVNATGDDITVGGNVTANGGITLTTSGTGTIGGAGVLSSTGQLSLNAGTGAVNVQTNVAQLTANTTGTVTVNEANNIIVNGIVANAFDLTAGSISHGTSFIAANTIDLSATAGDIGASSNFIQINNGANPVSLTADATGDIFINIQSTGTLNWGTTTGDNITLTSSAPVTTTGDITATNVLDITTNYLTNANDLTADIINIRSNVGSGLTIDGGGGNGTMNATTSIDITATNNNLTFIGNQDFFGDTTLRAFGDPGSTLIISGGANVVGHDMVTVLANAITQIGNISGNPLVVATNATIANSIGDVNLGANVILQGTDFAIIARGNINIGSLTLIDLSDPTGDGGSLFMAAGYDFTPNTGGQVSTASPFVLAPNNQSTIGGNINLGSANFNTSAGNGDGGSFTAIATTGNTNAGTINLGTITTTATGGTGGSVNIIGEGGVTVGNINTTGTVAPGAVLVAVAVPNIVGGNITVTDGVVTGGTFLPTAFSAGNMVINNINAGTGTVTLTGAGTAANTILQNAATSIIADTVSVNVGAGDASVFATNASTVNANGNGSISLASTQPLQIGTVVSANGTLSLSVESAGVLTTPVGGITGIANLTLEGSAPNGSTAVVLNSPLTPTNSLKVIANGGADININNTLTIPNITLQSTAGDVNLGATGVLNASTSATIDAFDSFTIAGTITTQTVTLMSGDNIITSDITGTITAPTGTFLVSTNGSIGVDANNRFVTNSAQLLLQAGGGGVFVSSTNPAGVTAVDIAAVGPIDLIAAGAVSLNDVVTSGTGDIKIVQNGPGAMTVLANANISTTEGDIILNNLDPSKKTGSIIINDGATIHASSLSATPGVGEVFIAMGPLPVPPYGDRKKPPKGVTVNEVPPGGVFLGQKGIDVKKSTNIVLNAIGVDLVFSLNGKYGKKDIHVGSNVTITADPPMDVAPITTVWHATNVAPSRSLIQNASLNSSSNTVNANSELNINASLTSSALPTDLNGSASALLQRTASVESDDVMTALNTIYGDEEGASASIVLSAALVSDSLPNAVRPQVVGATNGKHQQSTGCAVYAPSHDMTVRTPHAEIGIASDSVVLVVTGPHGTSVYDLHDSRKQAVRLSFDGQTTALSPGRHAMICATEKRSYADANLAELILHRSMQKTRTARGGSVFNSEFAVHSAINCVPALRSLMVSKEPACAKLAGKMTKTQAVILYLSQQSKEEFQQHVKGQITAMR